MLKNIDPLLGPELLAILRAMGHGEEIAIVDRNYPAISSGRTIIRQDGASAALSLAAVLSVLPLDKGPDAVVRMHIKDRPSEVLPVMQDLIDTTERFAPQIAVAALTPAAFKERAAKAVAILVTGEARSYGNILVRKGTLTA
jgi:L-fucose mutarotase